MNETEDEKAKISKEIPDLFSMALNLSKDMGIDSEYVKRHYCCILFAIGYYSEAEKVKLVFN